MEIDQNLLNSLPVAQRQKLCKQLRQQQVQKYNDWILQNPVSATRTRHPKRNKKGNNVNYNKEVLLLDAVQNCDDREVLSLLNQGLSVNARNHDGQTLLHKCCAIDNYSTAEVLISKGANVNLQDDDGATALHLAAELDNADLVKLLLQNGADVKILDGYNNFAFDLVADCTLSKEILHIHSSAIGFNKEAQKEIKHLRAEAFTKEVQFAITNGLLSQSSSLLHTASANGFLEAAKSLVANKININSIDDFGLTALHVSAKYGQTEVLCFLLNNGVLVDLKTYQGQTAFDLAANEEIGQILTNKHLHGNLGYNGNKMVKEGRINSKILKFGHSTLSKKDELFEAKSRYSNFSKMADHVVQDGAANTGSEDENETGVENIDFGNYERKNGGIFPLERSENDDLLHLSEISDNIISSTLEGRFSKDIIYTFLGDILIALNPFKTLGIYTKEVSLKYHDKNSEKLPPHIYATAENIVTSATGNKKSQCCVISGESGSGKTETCKYIIQHVLNTVPCEEKNLNTRIQKVDNVLEAFGNSQTVMNGNSSRFGKYQEILISSDGTVLGARFQAYMLEKSRVTRCAKNEQNFHIFSLLLAGLSPDQYRKYRLEKNGIYKYVQNNVSMLEDQELKERFLRLKECVNYIGFTNNDFDNIITCLAAVLKIGTIEFSSGPNEAATISNWSVVNEVSELLQVSPDELGNALIAEDTLAGGERIHITRTVSQAQDCRDALAKAIYSRLFDWIINGVNQLIQAADDRQSSYEIGILDLFGFENFAKNGFEQLCINVANEQLQHFFNQKVFEQEQNDCKREGVQTDDVEFVNNTEILDLFLEKNTGIFAIVNEESRIANATDTTMLSKIHSGPGRKRPEIYRPPRTAQLTFSIMHYAGAVEYNMGGVLEQNRDCLPLSVMFTMKTSNNLAIKEMFQSRVTRTGSVAPSKRQRKSRKSKGPVKNPFDFFKKKVQTKEVDFKRERPVIDLDKKGPTTIAYHFKNSLSDLLAKLSPCQPHFVRCIKPNMAKKSDLFDKEYVIAQLKYTGIAETVNIRKKGWSVRMTFKEFIQRYKLLVIASIRMASTSLFTEVALVEKVLQHFGIKDYRLGTSKVFLRCWHSQQLSNSLQKITTLITLLQSAFRGLSSRRHYSYILQRFLRQQNYVLQFQQSIKESGIKFAALLSDSNGVDCSRSEKTAVIRSRNDEISSSIRELDRVLDIYDEIAPPPPLPPKRDKRLEDNLPPPPDDLLNEEADGAQRRRNAPPLPARDPNTRLSYDSNEQVTSPPPHVCNVFVPPPDYETDLNSESGYVTDQPGFESDAHNNTHNNPRHFRSPSDSSYASFALTDVTSSDSGAAAVLPPPERRVPNFPPPPPPLYLPQVGEEVIQDKYRSAVQIRARNGSPDLPPPPPEIDVTDPLWEQRSGEEMFNHTIARFDENLHLSRHPLADDRLQQHRGTATASATRPTDLYGSQIQQQQQHPPQNNAIYSATVPRPPRSQPPEAPPFLPRGLSPIDGHASLSRPPVAPPAAQLPPPPSFSPPAPPGGVTSSMSTLERLPPTRPPPTLPKARTSPLIGGDQDIVIPPAPAYAAPAPPVATGSPLCGGPGDHLSPPGGPCAPPPPSGGLPTVRSSQQPLPPPAKGGHGQLPAVPIKGPASKGSPPAYNTERTRAGENSAGGGQSSPHEDLVQQIHAGVKLRPTPVSKLQNNLPSVSTAPENTTNDLASTRLPPPTLPKTSSPKSAPENSNISSNVTPNSKGIAMPPVVSKGSHKEIDVSTLPGYQRIPENCPEWRRNLMEKKNQALLEEAMKSMEEIKAEADRWKDVPDWKKNLMLEKEKKKAQDEAPLQAEQRKREEELKKLESLPPWKRELVMKKKTIDT